MQNHPFRNPTSVSTLRFLESLTAMQDTSVQIEKSDVRFCGLDEDRTNKDRKSIKIAIRIRFDSIQFTPYSTRFDSAYFLKSIIRFDSIRFTLYSVRFDSTHPQQNIVFFVLCSTHYVRLQKRLSISP